MAGAFKNDIASLSSNDAVQIQSAIARFEAALGGPSERAKEATDALVAALPSIVEDTAARNALGAIAKQNRRTAAELLLAIRSASNIVRQFKRGHTVFGKVVVEDGRLRPRLTLAQMEVRDDGYFVGEVGDLVKPLAFLAQGYQPAFLELKGKSGSVVYVGLVTLKPLNSSTRSTLKGIVRADGGSEFGLPAITLSLSVGPVNTPYGGYAPRREWPKPVAIKPDANGEFVAVNLTPGEYTATFTAQNHVAVRRVVQLSAGQERDLGNIRLKHKELSFYTGGKVPDSVPLVWMHNFEAARTKAQRENKPLVILMTARWSPASKRFQAESLNDPWVRHLLADFVAVKVDEDKAVEATYGCKNYPTLAFADPAGILKFKITDPKSASALLADCVKAAQRLRNKLPIEIQRLVDRKVLAAE